MSASLPLIAVTRSQDAEGELGRHLRSLGAQVGAVPLVRFVPALTRAQWLKWRAPADWLLLTSPQAVRTLLALAAAEDLGDLQVAAVGEGTARGWRAAGFPVHYLPEEATAEALGAGLPAPPGARALHLTSQLSEDTLCHVLTARGLQYQRATLYRTEDAPVGDEGRALLSRASAVTLASGSAARALANLAGPTFDPLALPVAVMGEQTARAARAAGFWQVIQARTPSLYALAEAAVTGSQRRSNAGTPCRANSTSRP